MSERPPARPKKRSTARAHTDLPKHFEERADLSRKHFEERKAIRELNVRELNRLGVFYELTRSLGVLLGTYSADYLDELRIGDKAEAQRDADNDQYGYAKYSNDGFERLMHVLYFLSSIPSSFSVPHVTSLRPAQGGLLHRE